MAHRVVIIGVGNLLAGDDGAGVRAAQALQQRSDLPEGIRIVDGGVLGIDLLTLIDSQERVVILDAVRASAVPGTIHRRDLEDVPEPSAPVVSVHDLGIAHLLQAARLLGRPLHGVLLGIEPMRVASFVEELSPPVAAALPELQRAAVREAECLLRAE